MRASVSKSQMSLELGSLLEFSSQEAQVVISETKKLYHKYDND